MTQGYGPDHGQQGQWGHGGQNPPPPAPPWGQPEQQPPAQEPQWGTPGQASPAPQQPWGQPSPAPQPGAPMASPSQPQWQQASPSAAPGGYPGASYPGAVGASSGFAAPGSGAPSRLANLIKWMFYAVLAVVAVRLIGNVITFAIGFAGGAAGSTAALGASNLFGILVLLVNGVVSLAVLILAVMVIIQSSGRGRTGAIIVVATMVLAVIAYWIVFGIYTAIIYNTIDIGTVGVMSLVYLVAEVIRCLIVFAALIVGAMMSRRWAAQNA